MYRDLTGDYVGGQPSAFVSEEGARVLLVGDPHLENLSSQVDEQGGLYLDWDDFDSAGYGPWLWDLRRLALSWWLVSFELEERALAPQLIASLVRGYEQGARGEEGRALHESRASLPLVRSFFQGVRSRWYEGALFKRYLTEEGGQVRLRRGEVRAPEQEGVIKDQLSVVEGRERDLVERLIARLQRARPALGRLKDVARKYGQGVSSYPLMRYLALFEGQEEGATGDELWELKELADAPRTLGVNLTPLRAFSDVGERVLGARRALQWGDASSPQGELPCVSVALGDLTFQARRRSDLLRGVSFDELIAPYQSAPDEEARQERVAELTELARLTGALLGGAHARATTYTGEGGGEVIRRDLSRAPLDVLIHETTQFSLSYGEQLIVDQALLTELIEERGPLLGFQSEEF